jgi:hypothetical protein
MGILHSFDRIRIQGSLRYLYCADIFEEYSPFGFAAAPAAGRIE